jgi:protein gp37
VTDRTGIEWTASTWNPVTGSTEVSAGCDRCHAKAPRREVPMNPWEG